MAEASAVVESVEGAGPAVVRAPDREGGGAVSVKEFASRAEISLSLAYTLVAEGRVPHRRIGARGRRGKIIVTEEDYRLFMERIKAAGVE